MYDVDRIISAELPDKDADPVLYKLVGKHMMHGPCGAFDTNASCMKGVRDKKCSRYFPKKFNEQTVLGEQGYPTYARRDDSRTYVRKGLPLDNRWVVPYNPILLRMFQGHLNIEKTDQSNTIKYLFKYVSKGSDRVIAQLSTNNTAEGQSMAHDEITQYLNCRYLSSCEAAWRIFAFPIHRRYPPVERLSYHLPNQQSVVFSSNETVPELFTKPRIKESMFLAWMKKNREGGLAKSLKYSEFPLKYTFDKSERKWNLR